MVNGWRRARTVGLRYVSTHCVYGYLCMYTLGLRTKPNAVLAVTTSPVGIVCTYHYNVYGLVESTRRQRTSITSSNLGHRRQIRPPPIYQQSRHSVSINSLALWLRRVGVAQVVRTQFIAMQVMQLWTTPPSFLPLITLQRANAPRRLTHNLWIYREYIFEI